MSDRACGLCGKDPAAGYASAITDSGVTWYCHGDEDSEPTCFMLSLYATFPLLLASASEPGGGE